MLRLVDAGLVGIMTNVTAALGRFDPAAVFVGLYQGIAAGISRERLLADLTEATYTGYARQAVGAWSGAYVSPSGLILVDGPALFFSPADAVTPNTILGWFMADALVAGNLLAIEQLDNPVPLPNALTQLTIVARFGMQHSVTYGEGVEVN